MNKPTTDAKRTQRMNLTARRVVFTAENAEDAKENKNEQTDHRRQENTEDEFDSKTCGFYRGERRGREGK